MDPIDALASAPGLDPKSPPRSALARIRARIVSGLVFMLPIVITFWIIYWIYSTFQRVFLDPAARLVNHLVGSETLEVLPPWWQTFASPLLAIILALAFLYILGYFVRSRLSLALDWVLMRVPGVTIIYKTVRSMFQSPDESGGGALKRVVLVPFPHPGSRALAFATRSLRDADTGESILCVWVLTGMLPPAGFTLFVPEADVIDVDWTVSEAMQIILSGGMTAPPLIRYRTGGPTRLIVPPERAGHDDHRTGSV